MPATVTDRLAGLTTSVAVKPPCDVAATSNITLYGEQTINSVAVVEGDRVLIAAQTDATENGIWVVSASAWQRAKDFDGSRDVVNGTRVLVGREIGGMQDWVVICDDAPIIPGTSEITFEQVDYQELALRADLRSANITKASAIVAFLPDGTGAELTSVFAKLKQGGPNFFDFMDAAEQADCMSRNPQGDYSSHFGLAFAQAATARMVLRSRPGAIYRLENTVNIPAPIGILGDEWAPLEQGSTPPSVAIKWHGGSAPIFTGADSSIAMVGFAVLNVGTATDFMKLTGGQFLDFHRMSFVPANGTNRFSRSVFRCEGNQLGYSEFNKIWCFSHAPRFIDIDGMGSSNGITPIKIHGRSIFETNALGAMTIIYAKDENFDSIILEDITCNQQQNELCILNNTDTTPSHGISVLVVNRVEWDTGIGLTTDRMMRLKNVDSITFKNNPMQGGGTPEALIELINSHVRVNHGNQLERLNGPLFNADATSTVTPHGTNYLDLSNTKGIVNDSATASGVIPLTYGTTVTILGHLADMGQVFRVDVTNGTGWTLSLAHPGIGGSGYFRRGQVFGLQIRNVSGGAGGTISVVSTTYFKLIGGAGTLAAPANGNNKTYWFMWDGPALVQVSANPSDVPN